VKIQMKIGTAIAVMMLCTLAGCTMPAKESTPAPTQAPAQKEYVTHKAPGPNSYDSADRAVVVEIDKDAGTITFLNLDVSMTYTLNIAGTSTLYDKFGEGITLDQIVPGDVADVTFLKSQKRLNSLTLSPEAFCYENASRYSIDDIRNDVTIGDDVFKLTENTLFFSEGRQMERMDLNEVDILTFKGVGSSILSVTVAQGHGYLNLENDESFVGGFIEVGQTQIHRITEDMLLTVPEGDYEIHISHNGSSGVKYASIERGEEVTLDIGDIEVVQPKYGQVIFSLSPTNTSLYIDGNLIDASVPVSLEYGIHQIIARADNYKSITTYMKVGQESAGIDVTLEPIESDEEEEVVDTDTPSDDVIDATTDYYKVNIEAPEGVEVYLNGNYIGISPVSFKKEKGNHVITLRKTGHEIRSYTISVDEEDKDISYSFADLVATE